MDGWSDIINEMKKEAEPFDVKWIQIKEKFGTLRAYFICPQENIEIVQKIVDRAEKKSAKICMNCGGEGSGDNYGGWFLTLCNECKVLRRK